MLLPTILTFVLTTRLAAYPTNRSMKRNTSNPGSSSHNNPGSVYLCREADWMGECTYLQSSLIGELGPTCYAIPAEWQQIRSIGADEGPECSSFA